MNYNVSPFGVYHPLHKLTLLVSDLLCIAIAFRIAAEFRLNTPPNFSGIEYIGLNAIFIFSLFIGGAYTSSGVGNGPKLPLKTFFIILGSAVPCVFFIYILGPERFTSLFGRGVFPVAIFLLGCLVVVMRFVINHLFSEQASDRNLLVLGAGETTKGLDAHLQHLIRAKIHVSTDLEKSVRSTNVYDAIIIMPDHLSDPEEQQQLIQCRLAGTPIFSLSDFIESHLFLVPVQEINNDWFIRTQGFAMLHSSISARVKRGVDILVASGLLLLTLPVTMLAALAIKASSKGPVFFLQTRVGLEGREFVLVKFRTMVNNAEQSGGAQWATDNDPRVTAIGQLLRKSRIDEIPQCLNILKSDMSIIGPRPERPEFTKSLTEDIPYYNLRHIIKPGLTGWAQVMYPYGASQEDAIRKLQYDLFYIKNQSLRLDLNILLRTILVTLHLQGR